MLTKRDLQSISSIVNETIKSNLTSALKPIMTDLRKIDHKLEALISTYDIETTKIMRQVRRIEEYLRLPPVSE